MISCRDSRLHHGAGAGATLRLLQAGGQARTGQDRAGPGSCMQERNAGRPHNDLSRPRSRSRWKSIIMHGPPAIPALKTPLAHDGKQRMRQCHRVSLLQHRPPSNPSNPLRPILLLLLLLCLLLLPLPLPSPSSAPAPTPSPIASCSRVSCSSGARESEPETHTMAEPLLLLHAADPSPFDDLDDDRWAYARPVRAVTAILQYAYPIVMLVFFLAAFTTRSIAASKSNTNIAKPTTTGPGGKPLPATDPTRNFVKRTAHDHVTHAQKRVFEWVSLATAFTFVGNSVLVVAHALVEKQQHWWAGKAVVVCATPPPQPSCLLPKENKK